MMTGFQTMMHSKKLWGMPSLIASIILIPICYGQKMYNNSSPDNPKGPLPSLYFSDALIIALSVIGALIFIVLFIILFKIMYKVETSPPPLQQRHGISETRNLRLENVSH
ncbi:uncharacterized protein LOC115921750 [Strongylocentrotus purpuratus]|uniref:Uncharacterized protein n=1 Tax=Strongylocentrotus purpuratus TaxID=7668 RepID=A0A7M7NFB9_STRPU|nr:uncharacterized protein LOC115921750 [Strongylocentrotus purpuratus]